MRRTSRGRVEASAVPSIVKAEANAQAANRRFIVTNLSGARVVIAILVKARRPQSG
jgi:hypothetical protein